MSDGGRVQRLEPASEAGGVRFIRPVRTVTARKSLRRSVNPPMPNGNWDDLSRVYKPQPAARFSTQRESPAWSRIEPS